MWNLKPCSTVLEVLDGDGEGACPGDDDDTKDRHATQVTVLDSDSEFEVIEGMSVRNPLTPKLRPQDPDFGFTESLLLRPIEVMAARMLQRDQHPSKDELLELFAMMPASGLRRNPLAGGGGDPVFDKWCLTPFQL